jgi:hypothetical protein
MADIPPVVVAAMDQFMAEADEKYAELVEALRVVTDSEGLYGGMATMGIALGKASKESLIAMVVTGLRREMNDPQRR